MRTVHIVLLATVLLLALAAYLPSASPVELGPPPETKVVPVADTLHGTVLVDNYRWLENGDDPEVQARLPQVEASLREKGIEFFRVSALARTGVAALLRRAASELASTPQPAAGTASLPVYRPAEDPRDFRINRVSEGLWRLSGAALERAASMTYWEHEGSVRRFQKLMRALGVDDALRKSGIQEGDTVAIGEYELDWQD